MAADSRFDGPGADANFDAALAAGRLVIARCPACGALQQPWRLACLSCGAAPLEQIAASGRGRVYSTTVTRRRAEQGGDCNLAIIELAEGVRLMSRVDGLPPDQVRIGLAVTARILREGDQPVLVFAPDAEGPA